MLQINRNIWKILTLRKNFANDNAWFTKGAFKMIFKGFRKLCNWYSRLFFLAFSSRFYQFFFDISVREAAEQNWIENDNIIDGIVVRLNIRCLSGSIEMWKLKYLVEIFPIAIWYLDCSLMPNRNDSNKRKKKSRFLNCLVRLRTVNQ